MVGPKVLNAVAALNAPIACSAVVATCLPIQAERASPPSDRHLDKVLTLAEPALADRFPQ